MWIPRRLSWSKIARTKPAYMPATQRFRVISDAPATVDSFSSHQPVADAIVALMDAEDERGKAIGLSGSWGSGKSTIVELLRGKLSTDPGTRVFQFDAWQHQGDPLRGAFLDSLIRFLGDSSVAWINRAKWSDELDFVVGRKTRTESTVEKRVTLWGGLVGILLLLCIPLGIAVANKYDVRAADEGHTRKFFQFGVGLFLVPFAAAGLAWLWHRPHGNIWKTDFWTSSRGGENGFLRLLIKEPRETTITTSSKTLDPTSGEFRDTFVRMLDEAFDDPARRLVIVIDNLDRVDPEDAVAMWSTMRIFFELESRRHRLWESRLWLIVPFDKEALGRLWRSDSDVDDVKSAKLVDSFVNKTFQIVFNVAPPVVRRRMDYFSDLYDQGFPDAETRAYKSVVYSLYDRLNRAPPSPREIKLFLNKLGALYLQSAAEIPLPLVALYQLTASNITAGASELMGDEFLEARTLSLLSKPEWRTNWRTYLAAVHFNVPPSEALHVLNGERIAQALEGGTPKDVQERIAEQGFWSICDRVIWERYDAWRQQPTLLVHAIEALREPLSTVGGAHAERVMNQLASIAEGVQEWPPLDRSSARGTALILAYLRGGRPDAYRRLVTRLLSAVTKALDHRDRVVWYEGLRELLGDLDNDADLHEHTKSVLSSLPASDWFNLQITLFEVDAEPSFKSRFPYQPQDVDVLAELLSDALEKTDAAPHVLPFIATLRRSYPELPWESIASKLEAGFPAKDVEPAANGVRALYVLRQNASVGNAGQIKTVALVDIVMKAVARQHWESAAVCLLPIYERALHGPGEVVVEWFIDLLKLPSFISAVAQALIDLERLEIFIPSVSDPAIEPFTLAVFSALSTIENVGARMSPLVMAATFPRSSEALRVQLPSWSTRDDVVPFLAEPANFRVENESLLFEVLRANDFIGRDKVVVALIARLRDLPAESWAEGMKRSEFEAIVRELVEAAGATWIPTEITRTLMDMPLAEDEDYVR
jgi:energy-coupling factor transporter ATP-binding protein EcfA2